MRFLDDNRLGQEELAHFIKYVLQAKADWADPQQLCKTTALHGPPDIEPIFLGQHWLLILFQRSAQFFCNRSDSKYFGLCGQCDFCHNYSALSLWPQAAISKNANMCLAPVQ